MTKAGEAAIRGMMNAIEHARGDKKLSKHVVQVPVVDIKAIRKQLGVSQARFATIFNLSVDSVRNWEQGRRVPEGPARTLLWIIDKEPEAVMRALAS